MHATHAALCSLVDVLTRRAARPVQHVEELLAAVPHARWVGVDAPIAHGLVAITGGYLGRDLRQGPRTLEALGLLHHSPAQLREMLHQGEGA